MPKISGHGHGSTLTDGTYIGGRMYLQKRKTVKESTDGDPVGEPPMLKSNAHYLDKNVDSESVEVRKRVCTLVGEALSFI